MPIRIRGRVSRSSFRIQMLISSVGFCLGTSFLLIRFAPYFHREPNSVLLLLVLVAAFIGFATFLSIKRFHDLDRSGWMLLAHHHGMLEEWRIWWDLFMLEGSRGENDYGPNPEVRSELKLNQ